MPLLETSPLLARQVRDLADLLEDRDADGRLRLGDDGSVRVERPTFSDRAVDVVCSGKELERCDHQRREQCFERERQQLRMVIQTYLLTRYDRVDSYSITARFAQCGLGRGEFTLSRVRDVHRGLSLDQKLTKDTRSLVRGVDTDELSPNHQLVFRLLAPYRYEDPRKFADYLRKMRPDEAIAAAAAEESKVCLAHKLAADLETIDAQDKLGRERLVASLVAYTKAALAEEWRTAKNCKSSAIYRAAIELSPAEAIKILNIAAPDWTISIFHPFRRYSAGVLLRTAAELNHAETKAATESPLRIAAAERLERTISDMLDVLERRGRRRTKKKKLLPPTKEVRECAERLAQATLMLERILQNIEKERNALREVRAKLISQAPSFVSSYLEEVMANELKAAWTKFEDAVGPQHGDREGVISVINSIDRSLDEVNELIETKLYFEAAMLGLISDRVEELPDRDVRWMAENSAALHEYFSSLAAHAISTVRGPTVVDDQSFADVRYFLDMPFTSAALQKTPEVDLDIRGTKPN